MAPTYKQDPAYIEAQAAYAAAFREYKAAAAALAVADTPATWSAFNVARFNLAMASAQRARIRQALQSTQE